MDNSYVAGFFDGEGSIGVYKNSNKKNPGYALRTQLTQNESSKSQEIFDELVERWGGSNSKCKTLSGKVCFNWQLSADKAVIFLEDILPYLILKKEQAITAIEWHKSRGPLLRDERGRIVSRKRTDQDEIVSNLLKAMKK